jgi:hypothetical protein
MYKRSATGVLQRCVKSAEGQEMLQEIHQGECCWNYALEAIIKMLLL